ncbi:MAG TPA: pirin family protein [Candidatus Limnocylindria bacterium]|nr:pirin family protein [Candidatus Limnocylindria bacterium]
MIRLRPVSSLFHAEGGWFSANWHFSFDRYWDPEWMGLGALRVFNDDRLVPGAVWPMHPHRDIEGITYVAEGEFEHADSLGNDGVLTPGGVQRMTLGHGALHSERNHSKTEPMRFIQLWIIPAERGLEPTVEQHQFTPTDLRGRLRPVLIPAHGFAGPSAPTANDAVRVHQDAALYAGKLEGGSLAVQPIRSGFAGYLFLVHGGATVARAGDMEEGSAAAIADETEIAVTAGAHGAELLLVEVPPRP